jgi:crossover junction endodeoxyribonuclease RuvC
MEKSITTCLIRQEQKNTKAPTIDYTRRLMQLKSEVKKLIKKHKITHICMEGMAFGARGQAIFDIGGLSHIFREAFIEEGIEFIIAPPKTIKKYFTGSGNADKLAMIEECQKRGANIPFFKTIKKQRVFDDNVSDAFALASFMQDYLDGNAKDFEDKVEKSWDK